MNERIEKLGEQADLLGEFTPTKIPGRYVGYITEEQILKFAELIVQECVAQIQPMWDQVQEVGAPPGYDYDTFDLAYNDCMNAIKEHFGVE